MSEDFLAHYGKKGMRWGQRKAARKDRDGQIRTARSNQKERKAEVKGLKKEKLKATSESGRKHIDSLIKDKKREIRVNPDASVAKEKTHVQKVMKRTAVASLMTTSAAVLGTAVAATMFVADAVNDVANEMND